MNRLSLGIQSFNDTHLQALGRIHTADEAKRAIEIAQQHFDNINLDLMYALPQQTLDEALQDMQTALAVPAAASVVLSPDAGAEHPVLPSSAAAAGRRREQRHAAAYRGAAGGARLRQHYETSAFAQPGRRSRHNLNYWQFGDYLGIGAGAHSKLIFTTRCCARRVTSSRRTTWSRPRGAPIQEEHAVAPDDPAFEFMMNALRLNGGFDNALFNERTGLALTAIERPLHEAVQRGLITRDHVRIAPTQRGQRFLNDLLQLFLPPGGTVQ